MSLQVDVRVAPQVPQILCVPPDVASLATADDTIELAETYELVDGAPLSESQQIRLRNGMAERADGRWAAKRVGDFGGRQGAGKTGVVITRIFGGLLIVGERLIIYTAHEFPTANEVFLRVGAVLEAWDDLSRLVLSEKRAHGDQGFELKGPKGAELTERRRLLFKTRTGKSGRGFSKADLIVYDEAQHLLRSQIAGSGPAKLANPNSQSWWSGSGGFETSGPAWEMRRQAVLSTGGRLAYAEHTAQTYTVTDGRVSFAVPDFSDRDAWYRANPGLGDWVSEEDFADLILELGELAPQELGCIWEPELGADEDRPINPARWEQLTDANAPPVDNETTRLALDAPRPQDGPQSATFATAGLRDDGLLFVGVREHLRPTQAGDRSLKDRVVDAAVKYSQGHKTPLILPPSSPARAWKADLLAAGVSLDEMTPAEYAEACGRITDAVNDGTLRHRGNIDLQVAVEALSPRSNGDVDVWSRRGSSANIAPFVAATCALVRVPTRTSEPMIYVWQGGGKR
jgi:hypothetical protein